MTMTLLQELDLMHASYVGRINQAVAADDEARAAELGAAYDEEATYLVAVRENRTDLLPLLKGGNKRVRQANRAGWLRLAS